MAMGAMRNPDLLAPGGAIKGYTYLRKLVIGKEEAEVPVVVQKND